MRKNASCVDDPASTLGFSSACTSSVRQSVVPPLLQFASATAMLFIAEFPDPERSATYCTCCDTQRTQPCGKTRHIHKRFGCGWLCGKHHLCNCRCSCRRRYHHRICIGWVIGTRCVEDEAPPVRGKSGSSSASGARFANVCGWCTFTQSCLS